MVANVTVLGASDATVTIPFTSATNAAAAQNALETISNMVRISVLTQYQYPGSGGVPSPTSLFGGVVVSGNEPADLGVLPANTYSVVSDATNGSPGVSGTSVVSAFNEMTVASGTGGIQLLNVSSDAQVFLAGGTNTLVNGYTDASMQVGVSGGDLHVDARQGASTISAYDSTSVQVWAGADGRAVINANGDNRINVLGANDGNAVSVFGSMHMMPASLPADPMPAHDLMFTGSAETSTFLAPGDDNVTVAANSGQLTLVGGTGDALVFANHGMLDGGAGTNLMMTDSLAGATTLMSHGNGDVLIGQGAGNTYYVYGSDALVTDVNTAGGGIYNTGGGTATILGSAAGNSYFNLGAGSVLAYAGHGEDSSAGNIFTDAYDGANQMTIGDFVVGQDTFSLTHSAGGEVSLSSIDYYATAADSTFGAVGTQAILSDGTKIDFLNANVNQSSFT